MVTIDEFKKFELIVAQIKEVKDHPNADRLYVLQVETGKMVPGPVNPEGGEPQPIKEIRQIVAGIRKAYTPEQLIGRRVVLVANLEPATIRGEQSNGMLLAASDTNGMALLMPDKEIALGSVVK
jgi:methionyl-tRNA synthetase